MSVCRNFLKVGMNMKSAQISGVVTLMVRTARESGIFPATTPVAEVFHARTWKPRMSVAVSWETAVGISRLVGSNKYSALFIRELIPYAYLEGGVVGDSMNDWETGELDWSWELLLNGAKASHGEIAHAAGCAASAEAVLA